MSDIRFEESQVEADDPFYAIPRAYIVWLGNAQWLAWSKEAEKWIWLSTPISSTGEPQWDEKAETDFSIIDDEITNGLVPITEAWKAVQLNLAKQSAFMDLYNLKHAVDAAYNFPLGTIKLGEIVGSVCVEFNIGGVRFTAAESADGQRHLDIMAHDDVDPESSTWMQLQDGWRDIDAHKLEQPIQFIRNVVQTRMRRGELPNHRISVFGEVVSS